MVHQSRFKRLDTKLPEADTTASLKQEVFLRGIKLLALALVLTGPSDFAFADDPGVETEVVDAMNKVFGEQHGFRATHATGVVVEGRFKASLEAMAPSLASLFDGNTVPVTARFSNGGFPTIPDGSPDANPDGMAVKFHLADGSDADMVTNSFKVFPVATATELRDLFLAVAESLPDAPKPTKIEQFVAEHPSVAAASATIATPDSFATEEYHGPVRFVWVPERVVQGVCD